MDGPTDYQKGTKSERQIPYATCGISNMTQMTLSMKQKQNHRHRE